ncbi:hypothetical protein GS982_02240 [Rhodococcus hoagii]|uniref:Terminase large subunit n=1 Tax=Rhodococcus hoagii TaxID=43767 RepID=A0A9Q2SAI6_RHOHA|nr:hypothetical protein [Prescottella equi]MBM4567658.1 hypothetical protein [Prescottella equi]MBM4595988.1 hypothetical protein [Prescottella equi]MBP0080117.1 hypothetical protein [Prescottella equi]MBP0094981.1 hypothetical protein [Prescottella equi]
MPWKPSVPGEIPTLGYEVLDWISDMLAAPDRADYEPFVPYREQEDFILRWYALDPVTGRRTYNRGVLGRPRGWGKSPLLAALACVEALGPVVPAGWDANGQPVGRPWADLRTPLVQLAAVSEDQTRNTWAPVLEMLREEAPVHDHVRGLDPMESFVALPNRGRMEQVTSSARTIKGARAVFAVLDQSEEWVASNGGIRLANTMRANAAKVGGTTLESPNAFIPGEGSVAEESAAFWAAIREGRSRDDGLLYDHREAPADTDMTDRESLIAGLRVAYGDSSKDPGGCVIHDDPCPPGHVDLDRLVATIWDPAQDVQQSRSDFLNQITHASDSWISSPEWAAREDLTTSVQPGDTIVLGFDGSKGRNRGKADATALVGFRVSDGHALAPDSWVWEQPSGPAGRDWVPDAYAVDAAVRSAFETYRVVGFYADPSGWTEHVAKWEAAFGRRLKVKASQQNPIAAWPRGKDSRVTEYVERFRAAVVNGELTHDGGSSLTRHVLNARRRSVRSGYLIYKAYPDSPDKIDAAYAAVMAWKARLDAVSRRVGERSNRMRAVVY